MFTTLYFVLSLNFHSCGDSVLKYVRGSVSADRIQREFSEGRFWTESRFDSLVTPLFKGSLVQIDNRAVLDDQQTRVMTYFADRCGLLDWISAHPQHSQRHFVPFLPAKLLCDNWDRLKEGIALNPAIWKGCLVLERRRELSAVARSAGYTSSSRVIKNLKDSIYIAELTQSIASIAAQEDTNSNTLILLSRQLEWLQETGDSVSYAKALAVVWAGEGGQKYNHCLSSYKIPIMKYIIGDDLNAKKRIFRLLNTSIQQPSETAKSRYLRQIEDEIRLVYKARFNVSMSEENRNIFTKCD